MSMSYKILYHHRTLAKDGQSVHIDAMIRAFREAGHEVKVVSPQSATGQSSLNKTNKADHSQKSKKSHILSKLRAIIPSAIMEIAEFCYSFVAFIKLYIAYRQFRPDFIYERENLYTLSGAWLKKLTKLPYILEVNAPLFEERRSHGTIGLPRFARWTETYCWKNADILLPVTDVLGSIIEKAAQPKGKMITVHNGVHFSDYDNIISRDVAKSKFGVTDKIVMGFIGYIRPWHKLDQVIEYLASDQAPDNIHLLVIGNGPALENCKQLAQQLNVSSKISFMGQKDKSDLPDLMQAMDIALQPSVTSYASPLKIFDYMAAGLAIIAPKTNNIEEILDHEKTAYLFDETEADAFFNAIDRMVSNQELRETIAASAQAKLYKTPFSWSHNACTVINAVEEFQKKPLSS